MKFVVGLLLTLSSFASTTAGIQEAILGLGPQGGTVPIPTGTSIITSAIVVPSNVCLVGNGPGSVIFVQNGAYNNSAIWQWGGPGTAAAIISGNSKNVCLRNFTLDLNGVNQSIAGINNGWATGINFNGTSDSIIDSVVIKNNPNSPSVTFIGILLWIGSNHNVVSNNFVYGAVCPWQTGGLQGISGSGNFNRIVNNFVNNGCGGGYGTGNGNGNTFISNIFDQALSNMFPETQIFFADSSHNTVFMGNTCIAYAACFTAVTDLGSTNGTSFTDNVAINCYEAYQIWASGGSTVTGTNIEGGSDDGCATYMVVRNNGTGVVTTFSRANISKQYPTFSYHDNKWFLNKLE